MDIKKWFGIVVLTACIVPVVFCLPGSKPAPVPLAVKQLRSRYLELAHDFKTQNVKDYAAMLAPKYETIAKGHTINKKAAVLDFARQSHAMKMLVWTHKIVHYKIIKGHTAILNIVAHFKGTFKGKKTFELFAKSVDTWVKTPKGWLWLREKVETMAPKIDGVSVRAK